MDFELKPLTLDQASAVRTDALIVALPDTLPALQAGSNGVTLLDWIAKVVAMGDLGPGVGKCVQSHLGTHCTADRLIVVRVGTGSPAEVRKGVSAGLGALKATGAKKATLYVGLLPSQHEVVPAAMLAAADSLYQYSATKSKPTPSALQQLTLGVLESDGIRPAVERGNALVAGVELAKEWANRPANHATPSDLANAARKLSKFDQVEVTVMGPKEVAKLGMGAFMAVAQGSAEPLRFIEIRYQGAARSAAPVVLVGKGITFDTGGISIKPAAEMDEMKFDMGGAASVLGAMRAIAELKPKINVVALIPSCENMPDGLAVKPGDVVTSMSGQTVEILNTDAEGRLILCDALTYAARFKPSSMVDVATLTGACVIALGAVHSGLFSAHDDVAEALLCAGRESLDTCWRMPLDDEYAEGLKSSFADMANVGGRAGGSISAAKFLQKFTGEIPWAHLDIAGTAWKSGAAKGSTGRPVSLLVHYVLAQAALSPSVPSKPRKRVKAAD